MKKYVYLSVLALCLTISHTFAQESSNIVFAKPYALTQKRFTFTAQPMQLFNWCVRHDFEIRLGDGPGWLQFGPAFYFYVPKSKDDPTYYYDDNGNYQGWNGRLFREPFTELIGAGLDINCKLFVNPARSVYVAAGFSYTRFKIGYWGSAWEEYTEDGLKFYGYTSGYRNQHINRRGYNFFFGHQVPYRRGAFVLDTFWGFAYRQSFSDKNKPTFDEGMFSYGYTGLVFLTGLRIGFGLK